MSNWEDLGHSLSFSLPLIRPPFVLSAATANAALTPLEHCAYPSGGNSEDKWEGRMQLACLPPTFLQSRTCLAESDS
jgi:hypothetical protein